MISEAYLEQQKKLHATGNYGVSGNKYAAIVADIANQLQTTDVLDYGCGQRRLESALGWLIRNYDPAIPEFSDKPQYGADVVACTDVLEHIEPDQLDAVLDDLKRLTKQAGIFVIATGPAKKFLDDGRNAHLIQEGAKWWLPKIMERFDLVKFTRLPHELLIIVRPL